MLDFFQTCYDVIQSKTLEYGSSLNDFDLQSRSMATGKQELVQSFCLEVAWSNTNVLNG